ncbi:PUF nine target 1 [Trypanosoma brucei equiperdum]|uniref:PUF nine target 1 n=1 Tax=Trypanosoma brucei equiperdum TaxID=630700 RepID=A0A3L6KUI4_9TRYP|nr:PUF nine target 1 [Trypanosoma brucei equiperdum]
MLSRAPRPNNRLIVVCSCIKNVSGWPFWKFQQMRKVKGVTDLCMLAFNSSGGSFEASITGSDYTLKNYENVVGYRQDMLEDFLQRCHDPGRSYFVYGGHGMGDYLELEENKLALQCHELASILGKRKFEAMVFDSCFMASLECAYQLRHNTRYIGACEGYVWAPDPNLDQHVFNQYSASAMSRFKHPKNILLAIQRDYCNKSPLADFAVLDTTHVESLKKYVEEHVMQRVYDRATFYNSEQQQRLSSIAQKELQNAYEDIKCGAKMLAAAPLTAQAPLCAALRRDSGDLIPKKKKREPARLALLRAAHFEHALYPSEVDDKHILDLKSYLIDMAREEEEGALVLPKGSELISTSGACGALKGPPPRTGVVEVHGSLPPRETHNSARYGRDSRHKGLDLFHRVVISHRQPRRKSIYASHLGGLSFPVLEYSPLSKPLRDWEGMDKKELLRKAREFLRKGVVEGVQMSESGASECGVRGGSSSITENSDSVASSMVSPQNVKLGIAPSALMRASLTTPSSGAPGQTVSSENG